MARVTVSPGGSGSGSLPSSLVRSVERPVVVNGSTAMRRTSPFAIGVSGRAATVTGSGLQPATNRLVLASTTANRAIIHPPRIGGSSSAIELDTELAQLAGVDGARRLRHQIHGFLRLGERDDVADRL